MARERDLDETASATGDAMDGTVLDGSTVSDASLLEGVAVDGETPETGTPGATATGLMDSPTRTAPATAPIHLPEELEVTVSFEIDRLNVTLEELGSWQAGGTVELNRRPQDPVRILLHQGAMRRVIGSGSVVVVDGRLGVQIDDWRVES